MYGKKIVKLLWKKRAITIGFLPLSGVLYKREPDLARVTLDLKRGHLS